jgi:hypothetical protein
MMHPRVSGATWVLYEDPQDFAAAVAVVVELVQKYPYQEMNQQSETQYVF